MNYRHAFHAGGFGDVLKHAILAQLILHLRQKETPFRVLDTHAGAGRYDLMGDEAARTGEAKEGVLRLVAGPPDPVLEPYLAVLRAENPGWPALRTYPGSPAIVRALLRPQDRLVAVELLPEDARALKRAFAGDKQVAAHRGDGYRALKAFLPPAERRGLVLIDPPFEEADELRTLVRALPDALQRWRTGIFALWYPIKEMRLAEAFHGELMALGRPALAAELCRFPPGDPARLAGAGVVIVNPPWRLDATLQTLLAALGARLGSEGGMRLVELVRANAI